MFDQEFKTAFSQYFFHVSSGILYEIQHITSRHDALRHILLQKPPLDWKYIIRTTATHYRQDSKIYYYSSWDLHKILLYVALTVLHFRRVTRVLIRFKSRMTQKFQSQCIIKHVIARNRKDGQPDLLCPIKFRRDDGFFAATFLGPWSSTQLDDHGHFVIHVFKSGTSQKAVELYSKFTCHRWQGQQAIFHYLNGQSMIDVPTFERSFEHLRVLGDLFLDTSFSNVCQQFLMNYIQDTLLHMQGWNSLQRLEKFISLNPVLAEYIWKGNFSTPLARERLGLQLRISNRTIGGFKKAHTIHELKAFITRKRGTQTSIMDRLPSGLLKRIERAQDNYRHALVGRRVGLTGWYISSDEIQQTQQLLKNVWKEADRWISTHPENVNL